MNALTITLIALLAVAIGAIVYLATRRKPKAEQAPDELLNFFGNQISQLRKDMQDTTGKHRVEMGQRLDRIHNHLMQNLSESSKTLQKNFSKTHDIISNVTEKLTKLDETNKQVLDFSKQLESLEKILKNPKQRGILGEYWLETLLGQVLHPNQFEMQHNLGKDESSGATLIPDAVIFIKNYIVPIDAKFSLENYNKLVKATEKDKREKLQRQFKSDVKNRIDETSKYIQPEMGTTDFAFMFVPAEGIYHNLLTEQVGATNVNARNLIEYAFEKKVLIVSATPFFAYLQTVVMGLNALRIEESVKEIQKHAQKYMRHLKAYEKQHNKLGRHLETTYRAYTQSSKELKKMDKDIFKITDGEAGKQLEPEDIEPPARMKG